MHKRSAFQRTGVAGIAVAVALVTAGCSGSRTERGLIVGKSTSTTTALPGPTIVEEPSTTTTEEASTTTGAPRSGTGGGSGPAVTAKSSGLPDGSPYGEAIPFASSVAVPTNLVWVLA